VTETERLLRYLDRLFHKCELFKKKETKMDIVQLLKNLKDSLDALALQLADAQAAAQAAYDKGFADGVASVGPVGPSQADLDAALAKVAELEGKVSALELQVAELQATKDQAVAEAVAAVKEKAKALVANYDSEEEAAEEKLKAELEAL
jgi:uncharacterized protein YceH (UPF0502 family)